MAEQELDVGDDEEGNARAGLPVEPARLWRAVVERWRILVMAAAVGAGLGVAAAKLGIPLVFEAETVIVYEGGQTDARVIQSKVDSLSLATNLQEMRKRLGLGMDIEKLGATILVEYDGRHSNLVNIKTSEGTAKAAKKKADTIAAVFIEHQERLERARTDDAVRELRLALDVAEAHVNNGREAYDSFRDRYGVADLTEETRRALETAVDLRTQADQAKTESRLLESQAASARDSAAKTQPRVESVEEVEGSQVSGAELKAAQERLAAAQVRLSEDHPQIRLLEARVRDLEGRVASTSGFRGAARRVASLQQQLAAASAHQATLEESATKAEDRLKQLSVGQGEATRLMANLRVAENHLGAVKRDLSLALDAARNVRPPFRVLAPAAQPRYANPSKRKLVALGGPVLGVLVALLGILFRALRGMRLWTASEVAYWGNGPVLGTTTWPSGSGSLVSLFDEMDDSIPQASGVTLVVGASDAEASIAREVAMGWPSQMGDAPVAETTAQQAPAARQEETPAKVIIGQVNVGRGAAIVPFPSGHDELAPRQLAMATAAPARINVAQTWSGPLVGPEIRRASRLADRVIVVVRSGQSSALDVTKVHTRLGRDTGIGFLLVDMDPELANLRDRVGNVQEFWAHGRPS